MRRLRTAFLGLVLLLLLVACTDPGRDIVALTPSTPDGIVALTPSTPNDADDEAPNYDAGY